MKSVKTWVLIFLLCITAINVHAWPIPDTGQTLCYDAAGTLITCPSPEQAFYGQDGSYTIDPPSYTKLDANGSALSDNTATWVMVKDNVTGLIWENKTSDGSIHDGTKTFTWCDPNPATNGGNQGICGTGTGDGATDTAAFIKALNDANWGGFSDWRLPSVKELRSIVDRSRFNPSINTAWFPSTVFSSYWSSTTYADSMNSAWRVGFGNGGDVPGGKSSSSYVRAVRGGQSGALDHLVINGDETVTDTDTGLMWQQGTSNLSWEAALEYAEGLTLAGYDDWRLPTVTELDSIVDYNHYNPAIDTAMFPGTASSYYWSATTYAFNSVNGAWCVRFDNGLVGLLPPLPPGNLRGPYYVRAVRGGQSRLFGQLVISEPRRAATWNIGEQKTITWDTALIGGNVKISLSSQGGKTGTFTEIIAASAPNNGSYAWTVTGPSSVNCVLRIEPLSDTTKATIQGLFRIKPSTAPNAPTVSGATPTNNPKPTWSWSSGGSGGNGTFRYKLDDSDLMTGATETTTTSYTPASNLTEGSHTLYVQERDAAGNWSVSGSKPIIIDFNAPNAPTVSGATATNNPKPTWSWSSGGSGGNGTFRYKLDDSDLTTGATETTTTSYTPASNLTEGSHTLYVQERNALGNWSSVSSHIIKLDTTQPVPVIAFPSNGTGVISVLEIKGTVSDLTPSSGLSKIEITVSQNTQIGTYYLQSDRSWGQTAFWHLAALEGDSYRISFGYVWEPQQSYTLTARVTDNAGNTGSVSSTFTYIVQTSAYTTLTMDLSSQTILNKGQLVVTGKLSRLPEVNMDLRKLAIALDITSPSGVKIPVNPVVTGVDGSYTFIFPDNNAIFTEKGAYALQTKFAQTVSLASSASDTKAVHVGASAGYAILVQGKLPGPNPEGLASHNKTTNRIYKTLRNRGFDDANIKYFNYTKPQTDVEVDETPSKEDVESAIKTWVGGKMNSVPAPLYIIMVNHGVPNAFHIGDKTISPAELSLWLDALETSLDQEAKQEKIITIIGACYSGSFIPALSKPNTNRIIITSAAADEESYKGPLEGTDDSIRSGEYFIDAFFVQLGRGYSLKSSFEEATRETEEYTRKGGTSANTPNPYFDTAMQHPLIDDNQDARGSNVLALGQGDGQVAKDIYLGTGVTYNTNAGMVEITAVTQTKYLSNNASDSTATLRLEVNNTQKVSSAWAVIRPPGLILEKNQATNSYQRDINLPPQWMPPIAGHYELQYNGFTDPGMYEIFYYIIDTSTPAVVSSLKRSVVYKDSYTNTPPSAPTLVKPAQDEVTRTTLIFQWDASTDTNPVTYNLVIATDSNFTNVVYRKDGIKTTLASVDASAGLKDLATYYWRVEAVDGYTRNWSAGRMFKTDNTNGLPGILTGIVFSDRDYSLIVAATIQVMVNNNTVSVDQAADGSFVLSSLSGMATLSILAPGYQPLTVSDVVVAAGNTTPVNLRMVPEVKKGDLNGDNDVTIADAILALRVLSGIPPLGTLYRDTTLAGGRIGMADVTYIMQRVAGTRTQ